ncbi:hypothetical protein llap_2893 [Limosa lapponica baueri]|uniref:Uncharacterized protein n=1 Tax=Limosa lapponica baueri TaxID=1758121 RepID=A0A2I0UL83_LIMLA|nr:hypothetical protein llap_2893 [Limosa lapponica baueri]
MSGMGPAPPGQVGARGSRCPPHMGGKKRRKKKKREKKKGKKKKGKKKKRRNRRRLRQWLRHEEVDGHSHGDGHRHRDTGTSPGATQYLASLPPSHCQILPWPVAQLSSNFQEAKFHPGGLNWGSAIPKCHLSQGGWGRKARGKQQQLEAASGIPP